MIKAIFKRVAALTLMMLLLSSIFFSPQNAYARVDEGSGGTTPGDSNSGSGNKPVYNETIGGEEYYYFTVPSKAGSGITYRTLGWEITIGGITIVYKNPSTSDNYNFKLSDLMAEFERQWADNPNALQRVHDAIYVKGGTMQFNAIQTTVINGKVQGSIVDNPIYHNGSKNYKGTIYTQLKDIQIAAGWTEATKNYLKGYFDLGFTFEPQPPRPGEKPPPTKPSTGNGEPGEVPHKPGSNTDHEVVSELPDLAVLEISPASYRGNIKAVTQVKIKNRGPGNYIKTDTEDNRVLIEFTANGVKQSVKLAMGPGATQVLPFEWVTPSKGPVLISAWINPDKAIEEDDYTNNFKQIQATIKDNWEDGNIPDEPPPYWWPDPVNPPLPTPKPIPSRPDGCDNNYKQWQETRIDRYEEVENPVTGEMEMTPVYVVHTYWAQLDISATVNEAWPDRPYGTNAADTFRMKSGYGFQATVTTTLSTNYDKPETILGPQKVILRTPETGYGSDGGVMYFEPQSGVTSWTNTWIMPVNVKSHYGNRAWYTPVWFPDDTYYETIITAYDAYCPAGALCASAYNSIMIKGNMYEDDVTQVFTITPALRWLVDEWINEN